MKESLSSKQDYLLEPRAIKVEEVQVGDILDLEGVPYLDPDDQYWEFLYGVVCGVERETPDCIRLDFEETDSIGLPPDLEVRLVGHSIEYEGIES